MATLVIASSGFPIGILMHSKTLSSDRTFVEIFVINDDDFYASMESRRVTFEWVPVSYVRKNADKTYLTITHSKILKVVNNAPELYKHQDFIPLAETTLVRCVETKVAENKSRQ